MLKDYACEILYHPRKDNKVADLLSRKAYATLLLIRTLAEMLQKDIQKLELELIIG